MAFEEIDEEQIRHTITFPKPLYSKMQMVAKRQFRSMSSVVLEACHHYYCEEALQDDVSKFLKSEAGRVLIKELLESETRKKGKGS